ncbi:MAG: hypothetical protein ABSF38_05520 [Verrucomicrobiota bacterium]|jgi:hypothetical protein
MENSTRFDLDEAVRAWREALSQAPTLRRDDLDQLEAHLRDSVALLQTTGLSTPEAFCIAKRRIGSDDDLTREFAKVNADKIWLDRVLWMVIGYACIGLLHSFASVASNLFTLAVHNLMPSDLLTGPASLASDLGALIVLLCLVWRSGMRADGFVWKLGNWLKTRPITTAVTLILLNFSGPFANMATYHYLSPPTVRAAQIWQVGLFAVFALIPPVILGWLLARSRRMKAS